MKNSFAFNSIFIREFCPGKWIDDEQTDIVYHYTSPDAFLSIISGNAIRFSDIRYMNDKSETIFFVKCLIEFVEKKKKDYPYFCEAVNALLKGNDYDKIKRLAVDEVIYNSFPGLRVENQRNFIFCTSNDADSLNMWNYYASNGSYKGYNIGFNVKAFLKTFDVENDHCADSFLVYYGNVIYQEKKQMAAIEELAINIEKVITFDNSIQAISRAAIVIRSYIETRGPFFKDYSFRSENEYRFLISIAEKRIPHDKEEAGKYAGVYNKNLCEGFCIKNGLIVPFLQVSIPHNAISRITISPITEYKIAKSSIKELLEHKRIKDPNGKNVSIYKSNIPIRF